jgi:hypothetical protein
LKAFFVSQTLAVQEVLAVKEVEEEVPVRIFL